MTLSEVVAALNPYITYGLLIFAVGASVGATHAWVRWQAGDQNDPTAQ